MMKVTRYFYFLVCLLACSVCFSGTLYVDDNGPHDPGIGDTAVSDPNEDGTTEHPYDAILEAINTANPNDTILLLDGTYRGDGNRDMYVDKALIIQSESGPGSCIIDLEDGSIGHKGFQIMSVPAGQVSLSGVCLRNAQAYNTTGVVLLVNSKVILDNCIFEDNTTSGGSAIRCSSYADVVIKDCIIRNNTTTSGSMGGAGIYGYMNCQIHLINCTISQNTTTGYGGGILTDETSYLIVEDCEISNNSSDDGGGIYIGNGRIENSVIRANTAMSGRGGGIIAGNLSISNSLICENAAMTHGGGLYTVGTIDNEFVHISGCTIVNNRTFDWGGGVFGDARVVNSIICNNSTYSTDGEQFAVRSLLLLSHCNVSGNENDIFVFDGQADIVTDDVVYSDPNFIDAGHWETNGNVSDWFNDFIVGADYRLRSDSPCIDAGDNEFMGLLTVQDIGGQLRILDGDINGQPTVDMGCYEFCPDAVGVIQADPARIYFTYEQGDPVQQSQTVRIYSSGTETVDWTLSENCPWLDADITSGTSDANGVDVLLSIDVAGLDPNVYTYELSLLDPLSLNSPHSMAVVLYVVPETGCWVPYHYPNIQQAVDAAEIGETVLVADGHYWGEGNSVINIGGVGITIRSATGPQYCIVSGTAGSTASGFTTGFESTIDGFTFTGYNNPSYLNVIRCIQSKPLIRNCVFLNNSNSLENNGFGAAINSVGGGSVVEDCTFLGNISGMGGAVRVAHTEGQSAEFTDCRFFQNIAFDGYSNGSGGAVMLSNAQAELDGCQFEGNYADNGGAVFAEQDSQLTIRNSSINNNKGAGVSAGAADVESCQFIGNEGSGIEIYLTEGTAQISDCLFEANTANEGGGINFFGGYDGQLHVTNSRCVRNRAASYGGGIYGWGGILELDHVVIEGNMNEGLSYSKLNAWSYDPISDPVVSGEKLIINNCLIYGNRSAVFTGGIVLTGNGNISNSIIWDNESAYIAMDEVQLYTGGGELEIRYCDLMGGLGNIQVGGGIPSPVTIDALGNLDIDPLFGVPGYWDDAGTPSDWGDDRWINGDYHLKSAGWRRDAVGQGWTWDDVTSPCIDAGNPGMALGDELMSEDIDAGDLRGENLRVNMGVYGGTAEASVPPFGWALLADLDNSGDVTVTDLTVMAGLWLEAGDNLPADISRNGAVNLDDVQLLGQDWLQTSVWY